MTDPTDPDARYLSLLKANSDAWLHVLWGLPGLGTDEEINGGDAVDVLAEAFDKYSSDLKEIGREWRRSIIGSEESG